MSLTLLLVVLALATFRLTRLVTHDDFPPIYHVREWLKRRRPMVTRRPLGHEPYTDFWWLGELVTCPWCASGYISGGLVAITWALHGLPLPVFCWFAVWAMGAAIADRLND